MIYSADRPPVNALGVTYGQHLYMPLSWTVAASATAAIYPTRRIERPLWVDTVEIFFGYNTQYTVQASPWMALTDTPSNGMPPGSVALIQEGDGYVQGDEASDSRPIVGDREFDVAGLFPALLLVNTEGVEHSGHSHWYMWTP